MTTPHYLRFARALALCSSLAVVPGCPGPSEGTDAGGTGADAPGTTDAPTTTDAPSATDAPSTSEDVGPIADAGVEADAPVEAFDGGDCSACDCGFTPVDAGLPSCDSVGLLLCCAAVGPLAPPELAA